MHAYLIRVLLYSTLSVQLREKQNTTNEYQNNNNNSSAEDICKYLIFLTGGLAAVIYTDTLQTIIMLIGAVTLMFIGISFIIYVCTHTTKFLPIFSHFEIYCVIVIVSNLLRCGNKIDVNIVCLVEVV